MKLLKLFYLAPFLIAGSCNNSVKKDKDVEVIRETMKRYSDYYAKEDYAAIVDFKHPEIIKNSSKEQIIEDMKKGAHNDEFSILVKQISIDSISDVIVHDLNKYAKVTTNSVVAYVIDREKNEISWQQNLMYRICTDFLDRYGKNDVNCNDDKKTVTVVMRGNLYFIYADQYKKWFILGDSNAENTEKLIPAEVRNKLHIGVVKEN